jgi:hypothetical protein
VNRSATARCSEWRGDRGDLRPPRVCSWSLVLGWGLGGRDASWSVEPDERARIERRSRAVREKERLEGLSEHTTDGLEMRFGIRRQISSELQIDEGDQKNTTSSLHNTPLF